MKNLIRLLKQIRESEMNRAGGPNMELIAKIDAELATIEREVK